MADHNQEVVQITNSDLVPTDTVNIDVESTGCATGVSRKFLWLAGLFGVLVATLIGLTYLYVSNDKQEAVFAQTYSFVPAEVSQSAMIPVTVPSSVAINDIATQIAFSPNISGQWQSELFTVTDTGEQIYKFKPDDVLDLGNHITVALSATSSQLSGTFLVTEDPAVKAVFPATGTDVHEATTITIVFNRPMVPVTSLSELEAIDIPVRISPATPGKFKWVSPRNLQFIPDTTLRPATEYDITIPPMRSIDGVESESFSHSFSTRSLQYDTISSDTIGFKDPIRISFNMPVDKQRTAQHISVRSVSGTRIPVEVEYGTVQRSGAGGELETFTDQRVLHIYQARDSHGRSKVWDFDTVYEFEITQAHALFGEQPLTERRTERLRVPNIVREITAQSERSSLVRKDLFDPTGTLIVKFYDEVSVDRSRIEADGLVSVTYGERCRQDDTERRWFNNTPCERVPDYSKLLLTFSSDRYTVGDSLAVDFAALISPDGFRYNQERITETVRIYPVFEITALVANHDTSAAAVDHIYVCSTTPLQAPGEEGMSQYITASERIVFGRWQASRLITESMNNPACGVSEFQTRINYGLLPETSYELTMQLVDQFGQSDTATAQFRTRMVSDRETRFHHLQKKYSVTTPDKTTLTFATENLTYMNMHVCETTAEQFVQFVSNRPSNTTSVQRGPCITQREERIELPNRYWELNYFQVNVSEYTNNPQGHYILTFSHPDHQTGFGSNRSMHFERAYLSVTDLSLAKKELAFNPSIARDSGHPAGDEFHTSAVQNQQNLYWVVDTNSLAPVPGATVTQFRNVDGAIRPASSATTNAAGIAQPTADSRVVGAVVRSGDRTAVVTNWADMLQHRQQSRSTARTYVYTDRPIYRPGQTVHIRGIDRVGFDGDFTTMAGEPVVLTVRDSRNEEIYSADLTVSTYGTFATDIDLPADAPLGRYRISAYGQQSVFTVEEYEGSPFRLTAETDATEYINGDEVSLTIDAEYYFGAPVQSGTVSYSVVSQDYFFDRYQDRFFSFGSSWYYCYVCWYGDRFLYRGETALDANGRAKISEVFDLDALFANDERPASKLITYQITAEDSNGRTVSTQESFIVHYSDVYLGVRTDPYFAQVNEPITVSIKTVDTTGDEVRVPDISYTVYKATWETFRRQEVDGGFYYHSEKKLTEVEGRSVQTDRSGNFSDSITVREPGAYEVHVSRTDNRGNTQESIAYFYARGAGSVSVPRNNNYTLDMEVIQPEVSVGDTASVLITTPHEVARALITTERGQIFTHEVVDIRGGLHVHEFPITAEYVPNVYVSAVLHSTEPAVQFNTAQFFVDRSSRAIAVEVTPNQSSYNPGDEVTLDITTQLQTGEPISAEVSIAVADLSVLALVGNPKKDPLQFFYSGFAHTISTASNLKNILHEVDVPDGTKGGDGVNPDDLATQPRGIFRDTAFWDAAIETDTTGRASVSFTLPDNLTAWQIEAVAVSEDTRLGTAYTEFTTRKDVMVQPLTPRFLLANDKVYIGAQVFNQTSNTQTFTVDISSESLPIANRVEQSVRIRAGESQVVFFETTVPSTFQANHMLTLRVRGGGYSDSVIRSLPMRQNRIHETVATAGMSHNGTATEFVYIPNNIPTDQGGITVSTAPTLLGFTSPVETYVSQQENRWLLDTVYRAATLAQIHSHANTNPAEQLVQFGQDELLLADVVSNTLETVYQAQRSDGGFAYSFQSRASLHLTLAIVPILLDLRDLGYDVNESAVFRAQQYVQSQISQQTSNSTQRTELALSAVQYLQRLGIVADTTQIERLVNARFSNTLFSDMRNAELLLAGQLEVSSLISAQQHSEILSQLTSRVTQSGRGAVLRSPQQDSSVRISEQIRDTAQLLQLLVETETTYPLMDEMVRWLMAVRDRDQRWYSDELTYMVTRALMRYVQATESEDVVLGEVVVTRAGANWFTHTFADTTLMAETFAPLTEFARNTVIPLQFTRTPLGSLYYDIVLQYFMPAASIPPRDEGISIQRELRHLGKNELGSQIERGDIIAGELIITVPDSGHDMTVSAPVPAGFTLVNLNLATEDQDIINRDVTAGPGAALAGWWQRVRGTSNTQVAFIGGAGADTREFIPPRYQQLPVQREELTDTSVELFVESLPAGVYRYQYFMRAQTPGTYQQLPAQASLVQFPEVFGRTTTNVLTVTQ